MKKYLFLAAALTVMGCGMTSCSNNAEDVIEQNEPAPKVTKLVFTVAKDAQTRASWDGYTPVFDDGDEVSLFSENNNNVKLTAHVDGSTVTLVGEGNSGDANLYFVYPYCSTATMADGKITSSVDAAPYYYDEDEDEVPFGTIGVGKYPANALSLAKSTDAGESPITFKGLMAILKCTPSATKTGYIAIPGCDDHDSFAPCGKITIDVAQEKITTASTEGGDYLFPQYYSVSETGYSFEAGTSYYIAFPPFTTPVGTSGLFNPRPNSQGPSTTLWTDSKTFEAGKMYSVSL